jgi:hypothetical protein
MVKSRGSNSNLHFVRSEVLAFGQNDGSGYSGSVPGNVQRSDAVRITNDWVASVAMADPVNWSLTIPIK